MTNTPSLNLDFVQRRKIIDNLRTGKIDIEDYYHLPLSVACRKLGISMTVVKKHCRKIGVRRWPYRQSNSLFSASKNTNRRSCCRCKNILTLTNNSDENAAILLYHVSC